MDSNIEVKKDTIEEMKFVCAQVLSTPMGKRMIEILTEEFCDGKLFVPQSSEATAYNLGKCELVKEIIKLAKDELNERAE